jgi:cytosine/adenosine deaminase-related metal-dependent hydrolase
MIWGRTVTLVNARPMGTLRFTTRILGIGVPPRSGDTVVDLQGAFVLPGLVNAHEHLELNHYGRRKFRDAYENASDWIDDMRPRLSRDESIREASRHPLTERLFIGAVKNLLAGVTTVAHHNPYYREMRRTLPIRVVRRYGWAHSFALEREPAGARGEQGGNVAERWRRTSADAPFFVHLAEGVDARARAELDRLDALGCLASNTVLVHGVAIDAAGLRRIAEAQAGLVWCPASNIFLFGKTAAIRGLLDEQPRPTRVALGTDSRLTGANDLLDELRVARETASVSPDELLAMVTTGAADLLRLHHGGRLAVGARADFIVIGAAGADAASALLETHRRDVALVAIGGRPMVADPRFSPIFRARSVNPKPLVVDGVPKLAESGLVRRLAVCPIVEPGVSAA